MATKRPLDWSAEVLEAIAAARYAGITVREVAAALGICIGRVEIKLSEAGIRTGSRNQASTRGPDADDHIAKLKKLAGGNARRPSPSAKPAPKRPVGILPAPAVPVVLRNGTTVKPSMRLANCAADFGIRPRRGFGGVSVAHLTSVYGPYSAPAPEENHV